MDTATSSTFETSISGLRSVLGGPFAPLIVDVRRGPAFAAADRMLPGAVRCDPEQIAQHFPTPPSKASTPVVVYCVHGHEVSKNASAALRELGYQASYLADGIEGWSSAGAPLMHKRNDLGIGTGSPSKWVTRERPKIDRIACPWLIRRFIDARAQFHYVPSAQVLTSASLLGAIPYDIPGVQFTHRGENCSFDTLLEEFGVTDPALRALAKIVRGADTGKPDLTPQSAGLLAVSLGLSALYLDDMEMLEHGMSVYDALYAWLRSAQDETHNADLFRSSAA
jgi:rhodanese-related sulfurtransferase